MKWLTFVVAFVVGLALDLGTKAWAFGFLPELGSSKPVTEWLSWTRAVNKGAAFGMFEGQHTFFMLITVVAVVAVVYFVKTAKPSAWGVTTVLGLILAGVFGNFFDRMVLGHVRDFIDVHTPPVGVVHDLFLNTVGKTVWPTFNVADIFITTGAVALVLLFETQERAAAKEEAAKEEAAKEEAAKEEAAEDAGEGEVAPSA